MTGNRVYSARQPGVGPRNGDTPNPFLSAPSLESGRLSKLPLLSPLVWRPGFHTLLAYSLYIRCWRTEYRTHGIHRSACLRHHLPDYLGDEDYRTLQKELAVNPELGDVMPGTGGFRKLRWKRRGKGRRGGLRIIYYYFASDHQIWFLTLYDKDEASDLTAQEKRALEAAITQERQAREIARKRPGRKR